MLVFTGFNDYFSEFCLLGEFRWMRSDRHWAVFQFYVNSWSSYGGAVWRLSISVSASVQPWVWFVSAYNLQRENWQI